MPIRIKHEPEEDQRRPEHRRRYRRRHTQNESESVLAKPMNPTTRRTVTAVLLFLVAILSTLSFFGIAGVVGKFIDLFLSLLFGVTRYVIPVLLVIWAVIIEKEEELTKQPHHLVGFLFFLLGANGLAQISVPLDSMWSTALQGYRGGMTGMLLGYPLVRWTGIWAATPILVFVALIGLMLITNLTISQILSAIQKVFSLAWRMSTDTFMYTRARLASSNAEEIESVEITPEITRKEISAPTNKKSAPEDNDAENDLEDAEEISDDAEQKELPIPKRKRVYKPLPTFNLLQSNKSKPTAGDIKANAQLIIDTLKQFGIGAEMGEIRVGPTVTQYAIRPDAGMKLSRITALNNDLALALAAHPIRIEAPIPGKQFVGIEVPNERVALVSLRELLEAEEFARRPSNLSVGLGKDVSGKVWFGDLPRMPHLLVAGATGSGKTVCLNTIILSLLYQNSDETLRFIMVDPKRVELTLYNGIPHLLTPVITDVPRTVNALKWCISEMERRFDLLAKVGSRDIISYNKKSAEKLPYIVFIIDELADLMVAAAAEVEGGIIRLAQMARAVGIHLIVATQRPSVDVITGLIKANIPARIAFSVASITDSRTILDSSGAEKLLGRGDMLYSNAELSKPKRLQGAFVSEEEMKRLVDYWKTDTAPEYNPLVVERATDSSASVFGGNGRGGNDHDPMFEEAKQVIIEAGKGSASLLQRRLKLGYSRAARIIDQLEAAGVIGPGDGAKPREVLLGKSSSDTINEEFDSDFPENEEDEENLEEEPFEEIDEQEGEFKENP